MKTVRVVAAVICDSVKEKRKIFATARGYVEFKGQWEFPGGNSQTAETLYFVLNVRNYTTFSV